MMANFPCEKSTQHPLKTHTHTINGKPFYVLLGNVLFNLPVIKSTSRLMNENNEPVKCQASGSFRCQCHMSKKLLHGNNPLKLK